MLFVQSPSDTKPEYKGEITHVWTVAYGCGIAFQMSTGKTIVPSTYAWNAGWWTVVRPD